MPHRKGQFLGLFSVGTRGGMRSITVGDSSHLVILNLIQDPALITASQLFAS